jgi:hypothetical protein
LKRHAGRLRATGFISKFLPKYYPLVPVSDESAIVILRISMPKESVIKTFTSETYDFVLDSIKSKQMVPVCPIRL